MLFATPKNIEVALNNIISDFVLKITSYVDDAKRENRRFKIVKLPKMFIYAPTSRLFVGIEFVDTTCTFNSRDVETQNFDVQINVYIDNDFYTFDTSNFDFYRYHFDSAFNYLINALILIASKHYFNNTISFDALADSNFDIVFDYAKFETIPRFSERHSKSSEARRSLKRNNF